MCNSKEAKLASLPILFGVCAGIISAVFCVTSNMRRTCPTPVALEWTLSPRRWTRQHRGSSVIRLNGQSVDKSSKQSVRPINSANEAGKQSIMECTKQNVNPKTTQSIIHSLTPTPAPFLTEPISQQIFRRLRDQPALWKTARTHMVEFFLS